MSLQLVRSRGLEPPRVAPLAPQASASTSSATTASGGRLSEQGVQATAVDVTNRVGRYKCCGPRGFFCRAGAVNSCFETRAIQPAPASFETRRVKNAALLRMR